MFTRAELFHRVRAGACGSRNFSEGKDKMMNGHRYGWGFSLAAACLLLTASLSVAQEAD